LLVDGCWLLVVGFWLLVFGVGALGIAAESPQRGTSEDL